MVQRADFAVQAANAALSPSDNRSPDHERPAAASTRLSSGRVAAGLIWPELSPPATCPAPRCVASLHRHNGRPAGSVVRYRPSSACPPPQQPPGLPEGIQRRDDSLARIPDTGAVRGSACAGGWCRAVGCRNRRRGLACGVANLHVRPVPHPRAPAMDRWHAQGHRTSIRSTGSRGDW